MTTKKKATKTTNDPAHLYEPTKILLMVVIIGVLALVIFASLAVASV